MLRLRSIVLAAATLALASPLAAQTLTCQVTGAGSSNTGAINYVIPGGAPSAARLLAVLTKSYGTVSVAPTIAANDPRCSTTDTEGAPQVPAAGCAATTRVATPAEVVTAFIQDWQRQIPSIVRNSEAAAAAATAVAAVPPVQ